MTVRWTRCDVFIDINSFTKTDRKCGLLHAYDMASFIKTDNFRLVKWTGE